MAWCANGVYNPAFHHSTPGSKCCNETITFLLCEKKKTTRNLCCRQTWEPRTGIWWGSLVGFQESPKKRGGVRFQHYYTGTVSGSKHGGCIIYSLKWTQERALLQYFVLFRGVGHWAWRKRSRPVEKLHKFAFFHCWILKRFKVELKCKKKSKRHSSLCGYWAAVSTSNSLGFGSRIHRHQKGVKGEGF